jgi:hypothetical protein
MRDISNDPHDPGPLSTRGSTPAAASDLRGHRNLGYVGFGWSRRDKEAESKRLFDAGATRVYAESTRNRQCPVALDQLFAEARVGDVVVVATLGSLAASGPPLEAAIGRIESVGCSLRVLNLESQFGSHLTPSFLAIVRAIERMR